MATLATFFKKSDSVALTMERQTPIRAQSDPFMLRALPNDDIYFYAKKIDNSRVVRQADPGARGECWSAVGAAGVLLMLGASIIAPHAGAVLEGYKLEALKQERQTLVNERRDLEVHEAELLSPERLNALARKHSLTSPVGDQVIHLDVPNSDASFASNALRNPLGHRPSARNQSVR
jgi:hypothetical protein